MSDVTTAGATHSMRDLRAHWKMLLLRGILFMAIGVVAVALPFAATLAAELMLGWLFVIAGIVRFLALLGARRMPGFGQSLFLDIVMVGLGLVLLYHPLGGELTLAMLVAAFLVFEAFTDFYVALHFHLHGSKSLFLILSGISGLVIAGFIAISWPVAATWAIGLLLGVNLVFRGAILVSAALALKSGKNIPTPEIVSLS